MKKAKNVREIKRLGAIILAAGKGTRMKSKRVKVLADVLGFPLIAYPLFALKGLKHLEEVVIVVGEAKEDIKEAVAALPQSLLPQTIRYVTQQELGTADAARTGLEGFHTPPEACLILNGDSPLVDARTLAQLNEEFKTNNTQAAVVTAHLKNPGSLGRIKRSPEGQLLAIVEQKDATQDELQIDEVNSGTYLFDGAFLESNIGAVKANNAQGELYLTDLIAKAADDDAAVAVTAESPDIVLGVNSRHDQAVARRRLQARKLQMLMENGVEIMDPRTTTVEWNVEVEADSTLWPGVTLCGSTKIGADVIIENNCRITDSIIRDQTTVFQGSVIESSEIHAGCEIGPYARIRPQSRIEESCKIGNFVEVKKSIIKKGAKASHLSYLGDCEVGENTNIGCGFITCNYDVYRKKNKTIIGRDVFMGSDCQTISPVEIGDGAVIGSGTTISKNVPKDALAVSRPKLLIKEGYAKKYR